MSRGCMISYGQSSGSRPDPVRLSDLAPTSLILGRPGLMHYTTNHDELLQAASEVFASIMAGVLQDGRRAAGALQPRVPAVGGCPRAQGSRGP